MPPADAKQPDFHFVNDASKSLLGYFVHVGFKNFLDVILANLGRWHAAGLIENLFEPAQRGAYTYLFDFSALDMEKVVYVNGLYFYLLACHKAANYRLMNRFEGKQVLYLRGYDFEGSVAFEGGLASRSASVDEQRFNARLRDLLWPQFALFKVFSPSDVYMEALGAQKYFYGDFGHLTRMGQSGFLSVYVNANTWKEGVLQMLDRMDHFVVYVSSITVSALWELEQLDTDERRGRVTVVFDEKAIQNKEIQLGVQQKMKELYGEHVVWEKKGPAPAESVAALRERLASKFLLVTPEEFQNDIDKHRARIAQSAAKLPPGARETFLDFEFHPGVPADKLKEIRDFSASVQTQTAARVSEGIDCLPLFLNNLQLRIYLTLLMGEHHETGLALAAYGAVMQSALDYYAAQPGALSPEKREQEIRLLEDHLDMARHIGGYMLSFGKSHEFEDISARATAEFGGVFTLTKAAAAKFFAVATGPS